VLIVVLRTPEHTATNWRTPRAVEPRLRGPSPEQAALDLAAGHETRVGTVYFLMSEDEVRRKVALPYLHVGSDAAAQATEGVFLKSGAHPRAYGNFARVLGRYVRDEQLTTLEDAIRRLTSHPAMVLNLHDRGRLEAGQFADVVLFDPATIQDHATFAEPHQYSTGVSHVIVNGVLALENGEPTAARPGRFVRGRAWTGAEGGGCRSTAADWVWPRVD
jgi:N-acyl-D-amino-acid deacylase